MKVEDTIDKNDSGEQDASTKLYHLPKLQIFLGIFLVLAIFLSQFGAPANAYISTRSVVVSSSLPSANILQDFQFDLLGNPALGSIMFEYCSNTPLLELPCVPPIGYNSSGANIQFQSGETSFSIHPNTALSPNIVILTRPPTPSTIGTKNYRLGNIINTSQSKTTTYVRIRTFPTTNATGPHSDFGAVAYSTQNTVSVAVYVPPFLTMCSGVTVAVDCTSSVGSVVDMGELSRTDANSAETQFSIATNSYNGYSALLVGSTMTAGNKVIPALTASSISQPGTGQFGVNLKKNTVPNVGKEVSGVGSGAPSSGYDQPNVFRFQQGDTIASSPISTEWTRYTLSYLVNVSPSLPAGRYAATLTVIATTTF
jgi:hypothetical protein